MGFIFFLIFFVLIFLIFRKLKIPTTKVEIKHIDVDSLNANISTENFPYIRKKYFMTYHELNFFRELENIVKENYFIVPQVGLSKIVSVDNTEIMRKTYHNKIDRKSVDFVLFDKVTFQPKLVVELDGITHNRYDRKIRDKWVDELMNKVGIKIVHIPSIYPYNIEPIRNLLTLSK